MNLILRTILQEKERIDRMLAKYQEELGTLPKGTHFGKEGQAIHLLLFEVP